MSAHWTEQQVDPFSDEIMQDALYPESEDTDTKLKFGVQVKHNDYRSLLFTHVFK